VYVYILFDLFAHEITKLFIQLQLPKYMFCVQLNLHDITQNQDYVFYNYTFTIHTFQ